MQPLTKRQREILDYLNEFIQQNGYAPSLEEIGRRFNLSSLATVHKHLTNLQEKGFIRRSWNRSRSVELLPSRAGGRAVEVPMLGYVAAGMPIEAVAWPHSTVGKRARDRQFAIALIAPVQIMTELLVAARSVGDRQLACGNTKSIGAKVALEIGRSWNTYS